LPRKIGLAPHRGLGGLEDKPPGSPPGAGFLGEHTSIDNDHMATHIEIGNHHIYIYIYIYIYTHIDISLYYRMR